MSHFCSSMISICPNKPKSFAISDNAHLYPFGVLSFSCLLWFYVGLHFTLFSIMRVIAASYDAFNARYCFNSDAV